MTENWPPSPAMMILCQIKKRAGVVDTAYNVAVAISYTYLG